MIENNVYFNTSEFDSPDYPGSGKLKMDFLFVDMLYLARYTCKLPFKILSGYRTEQHNYEIGGAVHSAHLVGCAVDIFCGNTAIKHSILTHLLMAGFNRFGIGAKSIHVDRDREKTEFRYWFYKGAKEFDINEIEYANKDLMHKFVRITTYTVKHKT